MTTLAFYHQEIAALLARLFVGFLFFFQGYDAVFRVKLDKVQEAYSEMFKQIGIPSPIALLGIFISSHLHLWGGLLLILGLFQYPVLALLAIDLLVSSIVFGWAQPMWDTRHVLPRLLLILFLLLVPTAWHLFSLDVFLFSYQAVCCH